jgi:hypothetical protein
MGQWKLADLVAEVNERSGAQCVILGSEKLKRPPLRFYITVAAILVLAGIIVFLRIEGFLEARSEHSAEIVLALAMGPSGSQLDQLARVRPTLVQMIPVAIGLVGLVIQAVTIWVRQRKIYQRYNAQLAQLDSGAAFVLFLRSFNRDLDKKEASGVSRMEEEIVGTLSEFTNVLAIDNTASSGITSGAVRIKCPDRAWRDMVETLSAKASCVIVDAREATPGLLEEINTHLALGSGRCRRSLFVYQDFKKKWANKGVRLEHLRAATGRKILRSDPSNDLPTFYATAGESLIAYGTAGKMEGTVLKSAVVMFARWAGGSLRPADKLGTTSDFLVLLNDAESRLA